tara:strand:+ start:25696 stop:25854 length:159 start_codon:yes stop_codon:yes gene_type:complete
MKTINVCQREAIEKREKKAQLKRQMNEALQAVGVVVFIFLILTVEDWIEYFL